MLSVKLIAFEEQFRACRRFLNDNDNIFCSLSTLFHIFLERKRSMPSISTDQKIIETVSRDG